MTSSPDDRPSRLVRSPSAEFRREPLRLSGAQPPVARDLDRGESEPRQALQLRLRLLPGRPRASQRAAVRRDRRGWPRNWTRRSSWSSRASSSRRPRSRDAPPALRRLNDIAFSGDGEPTTYPNFDEAVERLRRGPPPPRAGRREARADHQRQHVPHEPRSSGRLAVLDANNGEIWAKLDAGTEDYYRGVQPLGGPLPADSGQPGSGGPASGRS